MVLGYNSVNEHTRENVNYILKKGRKAILAP